MTAYCHVIKTTAYLLSQEVVHPSLDVGTEPSRRELLSGEPVLPSHRAPRLVAVITDVAGGPDGPVMEDADLGKDKRYYFNIYILVVGRLTESWHFGRGFYLVELNHLVESHLVECHLVEFLKIQKFD